MYGYSLVIELTLDPLQILRTGRSLICKIVNSLHSVCSEKKNSLHNILVLSF